MAMSILIVEDEAPLRSKLIQLFTSGGFNVYQATNGEEGLRQAFRSLPQVILTDINMPEMDGLTMLKELRSYGWGKNIPVIMFTNLNDAEAIAKAHLQGAADYLIKTQFEISNIVKLVKEKIQNK